MSTITVGVLLVSPKTQPIEPADTFAALLTTTHIDAPGAAKVARGNIVPEPTVVLRDVPEEACVGGIVQETEGEGVILLAGRSIVGVRAGSDVGDGTAVLRAESIVGVGCAAGVGG